MTALDVYSVLHAALEYPHPPTQQPTYKAGRGSERSERYNHHIMTDKDNCFSSWIWILCFDKTFSIILQTSMRAVFVGSISLVKSGSNVNCCSEVCGLSCTTVKPFLERHSAFVLFFFSLLLLAELKFHSLPSN